MNYQSSPASFGVIEDSTTLAYCYHHRTLSQTLLCTFSLSAARTKEGVRKTVWKLLSCFMISSVTTAAPQIWRWPRQKTIVRERWRDGNERDTVRERQREHHRETETLPDISGKQNQWTIVSATMQGFFHLRPELSPKVKITFFLSKVTYSGCIHTALEQIHYNDIRKAPHERWNLMDTGELYEQYCACSKRVWWHLLSTPAPAVLNTAVQNLQIS